LALWRASRAQRRVEAVTWIEAYETRVIEQAVERLKEDGISIPDTGIKGGALRTVTGDVARRRRFPSSLSHLADGEPVRSIRARLRGDGTVG
jgi:hypothetical protein